MMRSWSLKSACSFGIAASLAAASLGCTPGAPVSPSTSGTTQSSQSAGLPTGFPIGTWTTTITPADLAAVSEATLSNLGMSRADLIKENAGTFTMTLAPDGAWSTIQKTDQAVRWPIFKGTYAAIGVDGFDQTTSFPPDFAGDVVRFVWRTDNGLLYLTLPTPPDPILPVVTEAHPWSPGG